MDMDEETRRAIALSLGQPEEEEAPLMPEEEAPLMPESLLEMAEAMGIPEWKVKIAFETKDRDADEAVEFMLRHEEEGEAWWRALGTYTRACAH